MNGFERRKQKKKESILNAALELFARQGFKKVTIQDVAKKADVSPVSIYNHCGSKEGLIQQSLIFLVTRMMEKYKDIVYGEGTFAEKLESLVFDKLSIAGEFQGELGMQMFSENSEYMKFLNEALMEDAMKLAIDLFDEGRRQGYIGKTVSNETIMLYLQILRTGITSNIHLFSNGESYARITEELNQLFLYGLIDTGDRKELRKKL
jgi:AcrR family transcriptional regulator